MEDNETPTEEQSLREGLEAAFEAHAEQETGTGSAAATAVTETKTEPQQKPAHEVRDEAGKFVAKPAVAGAAAPPAAGATRKPPEFWPQARKDKFNSLAPDVQEMMLDRESEVEKGFTKMDEDRNFGKTLKEVITPYMATIQAEGGTPQGAVKDLLNTAYVLRTGSPQQKAAIVQQVIKQYGINPQLLGISQTQEQASGAQGQQQHAAIPHVNPEEIKRSIMNELQTQQMNDRISQELKAFTEDTKNVHFSNSAVKDYMSSLLGAGKANNFQDAYDQAVWLVPEIRSALIAAQTQPQQAQRTQEIAAKKKAGSSVSGSPGIVVPNSGNPNRSLREELEANMAALH